MAELLVAYTRYDRHTAKIAERIVAVLLHADCAVETCDLARSRQQRPLDDYNGAIAVR